MLEILPLHDELFQLLWDHHRDLDESLMFSLRRSNRFNKLDEGYWFYGNDTYLAVSFWSGFDWKNKTPNLFFAIFKTGRTILEISVQDSKIKQDFIKKYLVKPLGLKGEGPKYYKEYNPAGAFNYIDSLREFIEPGGDKEKIDKIIKKTRFIGDKDDKIGFIDEKEFIERVQFVSKIKSIKEISRYEIPIKLKSFQIKGYGPINDISSTEISFRNQFIFLTGLNGTGKSSVIKALGIALSQKDIRPYEVNRKQKFDVSFELYDRFEQVHTRVRIENKGISPRLKPLIIALAAYGPVRLQTANSELSQSELKRAFNKSNIIDSLREESAFLLDIHTHMKHWKQQPKHKKYIKKRKQYIEEILQDFFDLRFQVKISNSGVTYHEIDESGENLGSVSYLKLSTGLRSTLAFLGDLMIRMYEQQPEVMDPAMFEGIVLIDEIDIHLHPILQKRLVQELSITFPKIQFIITTHSPIPLLGAPINSAYYRVERHSENGVELVDLTEISVSELTPNALLTSDLFGMNSLFSRTELQGENVRTEDYYSDVLINDEVRKQLKEIAESMKG